MREDILDYCRKGEICNKTEFKMCGYKYGKNFKRILFFIKYKN